MIFDVDGWMTGRNPSNGGGFTIVNEYNELVKRVPVKKAGWTNNDAELWAVAGAVHIARPGDIIRSDSEVIVKWWVPRGDCKSRPDLNKLCRFVHTTLRDKRLTLVWVSREENRAGLYNDKHKDGKTPYVGGYDTARPTETWRPASIAGSVAAGLLNRRIGGHYLRLPCPPPCHRVFTGKT